MFHTMENIYCFQRIFLHNLQKPWDIDTTFRQDYMHVLTRVKPVLLINKDVLNLFFNTAIKISNKAKMSTLYIIFICFS